MPRRLPWSAVAVALLLVPAGSGLGQTRPPVGTIDATAYGEVDRQTPLRIRNPDATQASQDIAGLLRRQLAQRGYTVENTGTANVLSFRIVDDVSGENRSTPMVEIRPHERNPSHDDEATSVLLLGRRGVDEPKTPRARPQVLEVEVADLQGRPLWTARVTPLVAAEDSYRLAEKLVPPLLDRLGETVQGEDLR